MWRGEEEVYVCGREKRKCMCVGEDKEKRSKGDKKRKMKIDGETGEGMEEDLSHC